MGPFLNNNNGITVNSRNQLHIALCIECLETHHRSNCRITIPVINKILKELITYLFLLWFWWRPNNVWKVEINYW